MSSGVGATLSKLPIRLTDVEPVLKPYTWAPTTGRVMPPARPS